MCCAVYRNIPRTSPSVDNLYLCKTGKFCSLIELCKAVIKKAITQTDEILHFVYTFNYMIILTISAIKSWSTYLLFVTVHITFMKHITHSGSVIIDL